MINSTLTLAAQGSFDVDLENLLSSDLLLTDGDVTLGGTLALNCYGNCSYGVGDQIVILDPKGQLTGTFANVVKTGFATGDFDVIYDQDLDRVLLKVTQAVTPAPVPEPGMISLAVLGVSALMRRGRGKRGSSGYDWK
jgi:hypothetical protein